jgi:hypothetical protein
MSLKDTIRYNKSKQFLTRIDELKKTGEEFVQKIAASLERLYPDRFKVTENIQTRLKISFFGLSLLVRVEIEIEEDEAGRIRIYLFDDALPPKLQKLELEYVFDDLGNVDRSMTIPEAAASFGADLIEELQKQKQALLP